MQAKEFRENSFENSHRERKRKAEIEAALKRLRPHLGSSGKKVFEFGCGDGYQLRYLSDLGRVVASDLRQSEGLNENYPDVDFIIGDVINAPFAAESFDLIFTNHTLEHIEDTQNTFRELRRIGVPDCVYAFTVPTNTWLILSLPAQLYNGLRRLFNRKGYRRVRRGDDKELKGLHRFLPRGHGWRKGFFDCLRAFRIKSWQNLFSENGFKVVEYAPLLLYAPSEFPIVPTTRFLTKKGICSSALFILKKSDTANRT